MAEYSKLGLAIIGSIAACVIFLNAYFWWRFIDARELRQELQNGTCEILSPDKYTSGWKMGWSFPITGPSWTDVPCYVQLKAHSADQTVIGRTNLHFTYWQGIVWEYLQDSCSKLIPKHADSFACAFAIDDHGGLQTAYAGQRSDLPQLPLLFLMKACGLSVLTLGPFALICIGTTRGAVRAREISAKGEDAGGETAYASLPDGGASHLDA
mmetsp:Transcript_53567/g.100404  ORF Transcript_53567/g.100404 Transcript_53567/m.100404 type:complete len:211 (-) Transcript_53567:98-730(-)